MPALRYAANAAGCFELNVIRRLVPSSSSRNRRVTPRHARGSDEQIRQHRDTVDVDDGAEADDAIVVLGDEQPTLL
jgi:hypothetical protein